jgi:hypothetical protein
VKASDFHHQWRQKRVQFSDPPHHGKGRVQFSNYMDSIPVDARCNEREGVQFLNTRDKGKGPLQQEEVLEFWPCHECAASRLKFTVCKHWSLCSTCHKKGHSYRQCKARWHKNDN